MTTSSCSARSPSGLSRSCITTDSARPTPSSSPLQALILGIFLYTAFEWVTTNAEEVVQPKIIPRAMLIAIIVLAVSQTVFAVAMGVTMDADRRTTAYPQLLVPNKRMGHAGMLLMLGGSPH